MVLGWSLSSLESPCCLGTKLTVTRSLEDIHVIEKVLGLLKLTKIYKHELKYSNLLSALGGYPGINSCKTICYGPFPLAPGICFQVSLWHKGMPLKFPKPTHPCFIPLDIPKIQSFVQGQSLSCKCKKCTTSFRTRGYLVIPSAHFFSW